ncbi:hypothetical protein P879_05697 [Paragonimus westermani]|uniref:Uncharacterized protein n=1 Tax=Paragonimus westermani TaxID=34504 RepID=A0A8T0DIZ6_9TREM|nr:hypothetical protein P879_05697 [Paragonimus westermani]
MEEHSLIGRTMSTENERRISTKLSPATFRTYGSSGLVQQFVRSGRSTFIEAQEKDHDAALPSTNTAYTYCPGA